MLYMFRMPFASETCRAYTILPELHLVDLLYIIDLCAQKLKYKIFLFINSDFPCLVINSFLFINSDFPCVVITLKCNILCSLV